MADQIQETKKRKLRLAKETMRERVERTAAKDTKTIEKPKRLKTGTSSVFSFIGRLPIWKPLKFIGRFIIPPYFRASFRELRHVTWPNGKQTRQLTGAVIMFSVVFGIVIGAFDYGLDKLFKEVILK